MNIDRRSLLILLVIAIALLLFVGLAVARESPRFNNTKIPSLFIAKNWPTNQTDRLTVSEHEFTCQPDDSQGLRWACVTMLDGKRLEMTASYYAYPIPGEMRHCVWWHTIRLRNYAGVFLGGDGNRYYGHGN